jgi:hypothetical protein
MENNCRDGRMQRAKVGGRKALLPRSFDKAIRPCYSIFSIIVTCDAAAPFGERLLGFPDADHPNHVVTHKE